MDEKKPKKKVENPVREWISDNLRYIMLIAIIVIAILVVVFIVIGINAGKKNEGETAKAAVVSEAEKTPELTKTPEPAKTPEPTNTPAPEKTPESTPTPAAEELPQLEEASQNASDVVVTYFDALAKGDPDKAAGVVEYLSDQDRADIAANRYAQAYNDISVYTIPGDVEGSYVAFVIYRYKYDGFDTMLPAMTQLYVFTRSDGSLCIASEATQNSKTDYLDASLLLPDVQALTDRVQQEYEAALASDPALAEYINSLS